MSTGKTRRPLFTFALEIALPRLQLGNLRVQRVKFKEGGLDLLRCKDRSQRNDQRDDHAGRDGDDRRRVARTYSEQTEPPPSDLMADPISDVGDRSGQNHHQSDVADAANDLHEVHIEAARRSRPRPMAVKRMFGIHAHSHASESSASLANEQIVITT